MVGSKSVFGSIGIFLAAWLAVMPLLGQQKQSVCITAQQVLQTIRTYHVAPVAADSLYGERVLQQLVTGLDPYGLYLTQEDVTSLRPLYQQIDAQTAAGNCHFATETTRIFGVRYRFADSLRQALLKQPFRWDEKDTIRIYFSYSPLPADQKALVSRWKQQLKYMLLQEAHAETGGNDVQPAKLMSMRDKVLQRLNCRRSRMLDTPNRLQEFVEEQLLEALASAFDPHTNYFSANLKKQFEAALSAEAESFGIGIDENRQGDIEIKQLVPGGPAWKSNELHHGDVLLSLRIKNGPEKQFACTNVEEADQLLNDIAHRHAFLTVRKKDGKTKTVELVKEKLTVEENIVQSFVLAGERKIGYIALPGFYTQWDEQGREKGCAHDVARELLNLKKENVEGLILDLRYNGGGSVTEALSLAGIFIDEGPLGIEQMRGEKPRLLKDITRGTLYDAPLILLVNSFSASASEILAQALQNYNRAVIVGSKTYGKATMQSFIPLQAANSNYVKVTIAKYYAISGGTYQYQGVIPDVVMEDGLAALGQHESAYPTALRADAIQKQVIYKPLPALPLQQLTVNSQKRLQQNKQYEQQLKQAQLLFSAYGKGFPLRLNPQGFLQDYAFLQSLSGIEGDSSSNAQSAALFALQTPTSNKEIVQHLTPERKENHEKQVKELQEDAWLEESYQIMLDLLKTEK